MSHKIIRSLLEGRLKAWAAARSPALRIAYQNVVFSPAASETYLRAFLLPAGTNSNDLAGAHRLYTGLFQITIVAPAGGGTGAAESLADELAALFPLYDRLTKTGFSVQVMTPVEPGPEQQGDTAFALPVSFQYRADTT
ncbi:phage tail terminator-like protein [Pseudomonas migulae]|uniref:phage tail terminator-like protein n=1 Tax=Pseudomonas migulae TaxID=78543 RepID=UPI0037132CDE